MTPPPLGFLTALRYFATAAGAAGFLWRYFLSYVVFSTALVVAFQCSSAAAIIAGLPSDDLGQTVFEAFLIIVGWCAMWVVHEAAIQRYLVRGHGFSLRISKDEGQLIMIGFSVIMMSAFLFFVCGVLAYAVVGVGLFAGTLSGVLSPSPTVDFVASYLIATTLSVLILTKVSAASSLTIRDRKTQFGESFRVTNTYFWPIAAALLVMTLLGQAAQALSGFALGAEFSALIAHPISLVPTIDLASWADAILSTLSIVIVGAIAALLQLATAGPGALAALNDPEWTGEGTGAAAVFS